MEPPWSWLGTVPVFQSPAYTHVFEQEQATSIEDQAQGSQCLRAGLIPILLYDHIACDQPGVHGNNACSPNAAKGIYKKTSLGIKSETVIEDLQLHLQASGVLQISAVVMSATHCMLCCGMCSTAVVLNIFPTRTPLLRLMA